MKLRVLLLLVGLLASAAQAASTLRCGSSLVSLGDPAFEVEAKCGAPVSREFLGYRERSDDWGFRQEVALEEWVYGPRNGMYQFLRFEAERLVGIQSRRRR